MSRAVGIDLGTTYSLVAYVEQGQPKVIRTREGSPLLPSVVTLNEKKEWVVGEPARHERVRHATLTVSSVKRLMGRSAKDLTDQDFTPYRLDRSDEHIIRIAL